MSPIDHLHPASVHFPIAFLLLGSLLALNQLFRLFAVDLRRTIWLLLALGWLAALVAVFTGLLAQSGLPPSAPYGTVLNWHIGSGIAVVVLYGAVLYQGWIYRSRKARGGSDYTDLLDDPSTRPWLTVLLIVGAAAIFLSGWNGGALVYTWGVNVAP